VFTIPILAFTMPIQAFTMDRSRCSRSADLGVHDGPMRAVIPTRNAGPEFARTLAMVRQQQVGSPLEVLVVDTASSDGTVELCREFKVRVLAIQPHQFNHGLTRNYAIAKTSGEYVALLVQDAVPAADDWLPRMVEHLDRDPEGGEGSRHKAPLMKGALSSSRAAGGDTPSILLFGLGGPLSWTRAVADSSREPRRLGL
jgi:glycosyltransferase involved in cell wall biosynthesis